MVIKHLDTMSPVVADENFHLVVNHYAVGKFQIARAAELVEDITHHVEDDHPHDFALDDDDPSPTVGGDSSRVLEDVGAKLPYEVAELSKDLYLRKRV